MVYPVTASAISGLGFSFNSSARNRAFVPVRPASYLYSHFRYVSGVPAPKGVQGVALNNLKILDALIDHVSKARKTNYTEKSSVMEDLQKQMKNMEIARKTIPYMQNPQIPAGILLDIAA
ncbi:MAG: hypothetical protein LBD07_04170 [Spirochaetaceae bacterium]|jgi:hypothetical protein|nr:hypothetical protein [Spirochaetaceae bacterium]